MFSIITPTYNREDTLYRVYDSLKKQTIDEFHWVIVDDASTDETEVLVNSWIMDSNTISISYYKLEANKGKPFALNYGLQFCKEQITIIADSDDSFVANTLEDLKKLWNLVDAVFDPEKIATIWTLTEDENGKIVGEKFPSNFWQVDFNQRVLQRKEKIKGEKWHSWRTSILQQYKFFHNDNTIHIGESATWTSINKDYDFLNVNLVHRTYYQTADGLINQKKSSLKIAKVRYYTSYYQLRDISLSELLRYRYYRYLAFDYIKSTLHYNDKELKLNFSKKVFCIIPFIGISIGKIVKRVV